MFQRRERGGAGRSFLSILVISLGIGTLLYFITSGYIRGRNSPQTEPQTEINDQAPLPQQIGTNIPGNNVGTANNTATATTTVARNAAPGVVGIAVEKLNEDKIFDNNNDGSWGVGSGVIVSQKGLIITNHHVAGGRSKRIVVSLSDGRNVDGTTVWSDPVLDLAVVKINMTGLTTVPMGDANTLQVGETAIAIGNPLGLQFQRTVTSGIISALNRTIKIDTEEGSNYMEDLIQTDASINPGNSGGPLLNARGQVIGINTIKVTAAEAMGFAIPINVAIPIIRQLEDKGEFVEAYMGVFAYDREVMPYLDGNIKIDRGIYVTSVDPKGPAAKSGIKKGCIITHVDGNEINTMMQLRTYIYSKSPEDTINVTHIKKETNKAETIPIKLMSKVKDGMLTR